MAHTALALPGGWEFDIRLTTDAEGNVTSIEAKKVTEVAEPKVAIPTVVATNLRSHARTADAVRAYTELLERCANELGLIVAMPSGVVARETPEKVAYANIYPPAKLNRYRKRVAALSLSTGRLAVMLPPTFAGDVRWPDARIVEHFGKGAYLKIYVTEATVGQAVEMIREVAGLSGK